LKLQRHFSTILTAHSNTLLECLLDPAIAIRSRLGEMTTKSMFPITTALEI
jgi:hypothetical protein